ncbi:hypothetical protein EY06_15150, partial [Staphylococcus aureus]
VGEAVAGEERRLDDRDGGAVLAQHRVHAHQRQGAVHHVRELAKLLDVLRLIHNSHPPGRGLKALAFDLEEDHQAGKRGADLAAVFAEVLQI